MSAAEQLNSMIERIGDARLPTEHGEFRIVAFRAADGHEHVALVAGDVGGRRPPREGRRPEARTR